jgi:flagellar biosynthetic protein FliR
MAGDPLTNPEAWLAELMFVMLRIGGAFLAAPVFAAMAMPLRVRLLLTVGIAVGVTATLDVAPPPLTSLAGIVAAAGEVLAGLLIGFVLQLALAAAQVAGEQIAAGAGLSFAALNDPQTGAMSPALSNFLLLFMTLLFLGLDGHLLLIESVVVSYAVLPPGDAWPGPGRLIVIAGFAAQLFAGGMAIALPVVMALFALNLALGVLTRAAPQMNIFAVGVPVTITAGMLMLAVALPVIAGRMVVAIEEGVAMLDIAGAAR